MKESLVKQCINVLQQEDIKKEFRALLKPILDFILSELNPYIYILLTCVFLLFIMILAILIILIVIIRNRNSYFLPKIE
jgi:hypothetical protein